MTNFELAQLLVKIVRDPKELERQLAVQLSEALITIESQKIEIQSLKRYKELFDAAAKRRDERSGAEAHPQ